MFQSRHPVRVALPFATIIAAVLCHVSPASAQCGDPQAGDCCAANDTPACEDQGCCEAICTIDPFCCEIPWDEICVDQAEEICSICGAACGSPAAGPCCEANPTPGCEDAVCCAVVCSFSSACCVGEWNEGCAQIAAESCVALCCPEDLNGDGQVRASDHALLLGAWGPNPGNPADFDGNGTVSAPDLAQLLSAWGPCW